MTSLLPIEKNIIITVPKNYSAPKKGTFFEELCANILKKQSYEITGKEVRRSGMEVDIEAVHQPSKKTVYIECKFYNDKATIDSKIVDLCFAQSFRADFNKVALFSTVKLGKDAQSTYEGYIKKGIDFSFYDCSEILSALEVSGCVDNISKLKLKSNILSATLLIHPEIRPVWLFQEVDDGSPVALIAYTENLVDLDLDKIRTILNEEEKLEGLEIRHYEEKPALQTKEAQQPSAREVVSSIVLADDIMDPKPCRPKDFIGRDEIQKEIWDFLESARANEIDCRVLSLTGSSGHGKSSLVANLSSRFTNKKWKNKQYLYPVDVRSARGSRFVAEAICKAFNSAISDGFIDYDETFSIDNIDSITCSRSFRHCSEYLEKNDKVLTIFFDQFEEVFTKEELFSLFRAFKRFALDISAEKTNVVVGFSWRTGIFLGDDNPAYGLWHDLRDHRTERKLSTFDAGDSRKMISTFEKEAGIALTKPLKERLIQQAQGFPWFLKKLCIHLFKKVNEGISQEELLLSQMQIKNLFEEDLERSDREVNCLKFVAQRSPVDRYEATEAYGDKTVSRLISDRLLIKTGEKISVYWDVFRDFLKTNETPVISWSFIPNTNPNTANKAVEALESSPLTIEEIANETNYSKGTAQNIIVDLSSFSLIEKIDSSKYKLNCDIDDIPQKVRDQMLGHKVYQRLLSLIKTDETTNISYEAINEIVDDTYSSEAKTHKAYSLRIISWLRYAGLASATNDKYRIYPPSRYAPDFGQHKKTTKKTAMFIAASSFSKAADLIDSLVEKEGPILLDNTERNVVKDLISLGICRKVSGDRIELLTELEQYQTTKGFLSAQVEKSETIKLLNRAITNHGNNLTELVTEISNELDRNWKLTTGQRYVLALIRYNDCSKKYLATQTNSILF